MADLIDMSEQEIRNFLNSEIPSAQALLDITLQEFYDTPTDVSVSQYFDALVSGTIYRRYFHVPLEITGGIPCYAMQDTAAAGRALLVYTSAEELVKAPYHSSAIVTIRDMLNHVIYDDEAYGLLVNSEHSSPSGAMMFINRMNACAILQKADQIISSCPEPLRSILATEKKR